jgi:uncharacterized RDD family membrane protein YckC
MAFLKVLESPDPALKDQTIPLAGKEVLIGRGKENGLVLEDHAVSRHHARIVEEAEGHLLVDNNSANGSWVNGQRVTEMRLKPGDQIRVGKTLFEIQGVYDPEGTALLDVQGMGIPMKTAPTPSPVALPPPAVPVAAPAPPPPAPAPRPAAPVHEPVTVPEPMPMRRPAPPPTPIPPPTPAPARQAPVPPPAPVPAAPRPAPMPPAPMAPAPMPVPPAPAPAYFGEEAPIEGEPAGFWIRFLAFMIDYVIVGFLMAIIWAPTFFVSFRAAASGEGPGAFAMILPFLSFLLGTAVGLGYNLWFPATRGATPGKKMLGLRIVREDGEEPLGWGTAFMRLVGYMVSGFILYIGFFMIAFNPEKKGLHDMIAKTRVLKVR